MTAQAETGPPITHRLAIAVVAGILAGLFANWHAATRTDSFVAGLDFTWGWRAALALLQHHSPYDVIQPTGLYPFDSAFKYPLPFALLSIPFTPFSPRVAMAVFSGASVSLFTLGLTRDGYWRLPLLASGPVFATLVLGQSALAIAAAALIPSLAWAGFCIKPTSALVAFVYRPQWRVALLGGTIALAVSFVLVPGWLVGWWTAMFHDPTTHWYVAAIQILPFGPVLLLAALRWRAPEGRLMLAIALMPQNQSLYSGVFALLTARNYRECLILTVLSDIALVAWSASDWRTVPERIDPLHQAPWLLGFVYVPALLMVLRRANASR